MRVSYKLRSISCPHTLFLTGANGFDQYNPYSLILQSIFASIIRVAGVDT